MLRCTRVYLQQQLRRRVGCSHSGGHSRANSVQLLDLFAPDLEQARAIPLYPNPAGPRTVHTEGQLCLLCQESVRTLKEHKENSIIYLAIKIVNKYIWFNRPIAI